MKNASAAFMSAMASPSRVIRGKVVIVDGGLTSEYGYANKLQSIESEVSAVKGKMFGAVVSYKTTIKLIDVDNTVSVNVGAKATPQIGLANELLALTPVYISSNTFDEVKGIRTLVGEDAIAFTDKYTWNDIADGLGDTFTLNQVFAAIAAQIGIGAVIDSTLVNLTASYTKASFNVNGDETLRQILTSAAEASGAVVFINNAGKLRVRDLSSSTNLAIDRTVQFSLATDLSSTLSGIVSINELNDYISVGNTTSYVSTISVNPFLDVSDGQTQGRLQNLLVKVKRTFYPYSLKWRGNPALEIGDKIKLTLKDGSTIDTWYLGEKIKYTGGMSAESSWEATESENPEIGSQTIAETNRRTLAKVDKANQKITLLTETTTEQGKKLSEFEVSLDGIRSEVSEVSKTADGAMTKATTVEQTVDGLKVQVTEVSSKADQASSDAASAVEKSNELEITVDGLSSKISAVETKADNADANASTAITKTNELEVTVDGYNARITEAESKAGQAETDASAAVTKANEIEVTVDGLSSKITAVEAKADSADGKADTAITKTNELEVTVDGYSARITEAENTAASAESDASAAVTKSNEIEVTVNGLSSKITSVEQVANDASDTADTANSNASAAVTKVNNLEVTVDGYSAEISETKTIANNAKDTADDAESTANTAYTKSVQLEATVDGLSSTVTEVQSDLSTAETNIATNTSSINQLSDEIDLKVSTSDYTGAEIVSRINVAPSTVVISSPHIDLSGLVTISSLSNGTTTVDGACIKTGSISANRISGGELSGVSLNIADKFLVSNSGVMTCTGATLGGTLNAVSGTFTDLITTGSIKSSSSGGFGIEFSSTGDGFVGNRKTSSTFAGMQYVSSADQLILTNSGNSVSFVGSGVSFIQMSGSRDYISTARFITNNYGSSLPSSGTTGEVFYLIE